MSEIRATASQQRSERQAADLQSQAADLQSTAVVTRELQRQIAAQEVTLRDQEVALDQVTQRGEGGGARLGTGLGREERWLLGWKEGSGKEGAGGGKVVWANIRCFFASATPDP